MRSRFLAGNLLITLLAVVAVGVPLALLARHQIFTSARENLRQEAASIAAGLEDRLDTGTSPDLTHYRTVFPGRRLIITDTTGRQASSGPVLVGPVDQASVVVSTMTVTVQADQGPTAVRAREVTVLVAALALLAVSAAVVLSITQARRLSAPLGRLATRADALGRGQFTAAPVRSGIDEIDQISDQLERSATQIATMISLQRDFASDAAHQLRTPLTGIGLRLEELIRLGDGELRREAEQALLQVERLEGVVSSLLTRAHGDAADPETLDLGTFVTGTARLAAPVHRCWTIHQPAPRPRRDRAHTASPSGEVQRAFWRLIAAGVSSEDAAVAVGVSTPVGSRWFRHAGGMSPMSLAEPTGRYLSFVDREEIALLVAQRHGVREIARRTGRDPSTISRELRRNAATRSGQRGYRAVVAQWKAQQAARRPKPAKLATNPVLRGYVEQRLSGAVKDADGARSRDPTCHGPAVATAVVRTHAGAARGVRSRSAND